MDIVVKVIPVYRGYSFSRLFFLESLDLEDTFQNLESHYTKLMVDIKNAFPELVSIDSPAKFVLVNSDVDVDHPVLLTKAQDFHAVIHLNVMNWNVGTPVTLHILESLKIHPSQQQTTPNQLSEAIPIPREKDDFIVIQKCVLEDLKSKITDQHDKINRLSDKMQTILYELQGDSVTGSPKLPFVDLGNYWSESILNEIKRLSDETQGDCVYTPGLHVVDSESDWTQNGLLVEDESSADGPVPSNSNNETSGSAVTLQINPKEAEMHTGDDLSVTKKFAQLPSEENHSISMDLREGATSLLVDQDVLNDADAVSIKSGSSFSSVSFTEDDMIESSTSIQEPILEKDESILRCLD